MPNATGPLGAGELILSGSNSYQGGTYVDGGTLIANTGSAIPDSTGLIVGAGGTFVFDPTVTGSPTAELSRVPQPAAEINPVPEPGTIVLLLAALGSAAIYCRFRRPRAIGVR